MATKLNQTRHKVKATSFADPADIHAFQRCKERGGTDKECFAKGDNGIGLWDQSCAEGTGPCCALPPEDYIEQWGSINVAKNKLVLVERLGKSVICDCRDRMPYRKFITNGAGIDLNPDACKALGLRPPASATVTWRWIEVQPAKPV
jgi:hypothetical protein